MASSDTIAAIATALSDSGIGIIRISGEKAIEISDSVFCNKYGKKVLKNVQSHTIHYGYILNPFDFPDMDDYRKKIVDEVMVSVFRAPKSYTTEDTVEINCHGGILMTQKILKLVLRAGARLAEPGEFTKRAFLNGRIDLSEAEAVMDIIHSKNELSLKASVSQLRGDLADKIRILREDIIYEIAFIESALDDPEHISLDGYPDRLREKLKNMIQSISSLLETSENGRIMKEGISTVIVGKPNAGKSSLLNMILGQERAIVTDIAGTTRDVLEESVRLRDIHLNIIDTAGIRDTDDIVEKIGVDRARKYAKDADLVLYVVDTSVEIDENDKEIMSLIGDKKVILLFNKSDLEQKVSEEDFIESLNHCKKESGENLNFCGIGSLAVIHTSAKENEGLEELEQKIRELFFHGEIKSENEIMITNIRHKQALQDAMDALKLVSKSIEEGMPEDFYSIDLMSAYSSLGLIIGEEVEDDLVEEIFSKFCMGK